MANEQDDVDFFESEDTSQGAERFKGAITNLAREARLIEDEISELEGRIKDLGRRKVDILQFKLPDLLRQAGVQEITTLEGLRVSMKFVIGTIPAEKKEEAYEWLDSHGHADIIKRNLALTFSKGDAQQAEQAREALRQMGFDPTIKLDIHPQTWMAFGREQVNSGKMLPLTDWGVYFGDTAVIK